MKEGGMVPRDFVRRDGDWLPVKALLTLLYSKVVALAWRIYIV